MIRAAAHVNILRCINALLGITRPGAHLVISAVEKNARNSTRIHDRRPVRRQAAVGTFDRPAGALCRSPPTLFEIIVEAYLAAARTSPTSLFIDAGSRLWPSSPSGRRVYANSFKGRKY